jgi:hypothetical protein
MRHVRKYLSLGSKISFRSLRKCFLLVEVTFSMLPSLVEEAPSLYIVEYLRQIAYKVVLLVWMLTNY